MNGFQLELLRFLRMFSPQHTIVYETITDTIMQQNTKLLSLSILLMIYFSSNGIMSLIEAFNKTSHNIETRKSLNLRIVALISVIGINLLIMLIISLIVMSNTFILSFSHPRNYQSYISNFDWCG